MMGYQINSFVVVVDECKVTKVRDDAQPVICDVCARSSNAGSVSSFDLAQIRNVDQSASCVVHDDRRLQFPTRSRYPYQSLQRPGRFLL